ncbi:IclR family transcriptional regulator [Brevibacillus sp. SAFN-007a]|uniref:IclR family transcriptional regulator n=1 Tax=Brevibacillus sp. SAFN-007a TaxID=3436862 RepID=UPI003F7F8FD5
MSPYEVATLKKGLLILDALQQNDRLTLTEIMRAFDLNKSTTFRLLYTLEQMGYVKKEGLAYVATEKGGKQHVSVNPRQQWLSVPLLAQLSREIGETLCVGVLHQTQIVTTQIIEGIHGYAYCSQVGSQAPAHHSAYGKAILAFLDPNRQEAILRQIELRAQTKNTFDDLHLLKEHLKVIRQQGYALDDEEAQIGLRCIAAPLFYKGEVTAAVSIAAPTTRLTKQAIRTWSKKLVACCQQISQQLGK